ncbi:MAG: hypothetical protein ABIP30_11905 [Ferruginibacter sp.]
MRYSKYLVLIIFLLPIKLFAQQATLENTDITGLWKGTLYNDTTQQYYQYEVGISKQKGKLTGFSHTWFILDDKQYYGVKKVKIKEADGKIIIEDDGLIANNYPVAPAKGVKQLNILELNAADSIMILTGPFTTNSTKTYRPLTGTINLQRKNDYWQSALVPHLEELGLAKELSFVKDDKVLARNDQVFVTIVKPVVKAKEMATVKTILIAKNEIPLPEIKTDTAKAVIENTNTETAKKEPETNKNNSSGKPPVGKMEKSVVTSAEKDKNAELAAPPKKKQAQAIVKSVPKPNEPTIASNQPVETAKNKTVANETKEKPAIITVQKSVDTAALVKVTEKQTAPLIQNTVPVIKILDAAKEVDIRKTLLEQTVYFKSDSLQLTLYDNGEVDGDTVSVLMNGNVIMPRVGLSTNAVRKTIYIDNTEDSIQLVMYAENLGSIPPNTGLMVVRDGKDIYEIRFSGDLQKNSAILFRRNKNK